jgi:hypothetical protein
MRSISKWLLVVGVAALIASPVMAQGGRGQGRGGFGGGPAMLINMEPVQKELKLSEDQVTKARETAQATREKFQEELAKLQDLDPQDRFPKMAEINAKISDEIYASLAKDWKPEQVKRLKQLGVQQMGLQAFMNPAVDKALKLTDEQKEKVRTFTTEQREEMQNIFQGGGGGDPAEMQKKMATLRKEFTSKAVAVLTDDQKKEWKELTGEPFEFPAMGFGGAGGKGGKGGRKKKDKDN